MKLMETEFQGHKAVELTTAKLQLRVTTDFGPRICFFGKPGGDNLLLWEENKYFRAQWGKKWDLKGGHRVWITRPLADENEETYQLEQTPCRVKQLDDGWDILGEVDPLFRIRKGIKVRVVADDKIIVDNYLVNVGNLLYSGGIWALTCSLPTDTTTYGIPLGDGNMWDYCRIIMFRKWETHKGGYNDDQFTFGEDMMFIKPRGRENKRMLQADRGIIAMHDPARDTLFAKQVAYDRTAHYPQGCNIAAYVGPENFMVEMETMGPEMTVKPDETIHNKETWFLGSAATRLTVSDLEAALQ